MNAFLLAVESEDFLLDSSKISSSEEAVEEEISVVSYQFLKDRALLSARVRADDDFDISIVKKHGVAIDHWRASKSEYVPRNQSSKRMPIHQLTSCRLDRNENRSIH